jgi:hypothetical protein
MPKHLTETGNQTISGSLTTSGNVGVGTSSPSSKLHSLATTEQLRLGFDASNYMSATVSSAGAVTLDAVGASAGFAFSDPVTATAQPALSAMTDNHVMTRSLIDSLLLDTSLLYLRDEFVAVADGNQPFGELGWAYIGVGGAGNVRPFTPNNTFGSAAIVTAAAARAANTAIFDASNIIGGAGFVFTTNGLENPSTTVKWRFQTTSLSGGFAVGFQSFPTNNLYKQNRFFGLRYAVPSSAWEASTPISLNEYRRPTTANGRRYYAFVAGTTSGSEPVWPTTSAGNVVDGTVTWVEDGSDGDTNILLHNCPNTADEALSSTYVNTGVVANINTWYNVVMSYMSGSTWNFTINGVNVGNLTMTSNNSAAILLPSFKVQTTTNSSNFLSMDYFLMLSRGITR